MLLTLTAFVLCFLFTVIDQVCLSIACWHARNADLIISKSDEQLNVRELKTWSMISDFARCDSNEKLRGLVTVHDALFKARIVTFLLFILAGLYSVTKW
ncbi:hypothetical protein V6x_35160 [Gimesia chilikensis]|uniref:Uncharacterized protein n=1 Tax=Gimesia chilikensis TaxID=2605989 RepID=A0A517WEW6_9PLAN|nr:hypothetical protein V6x_35160 [Gimesia chilikensis]